MLPLGELDTKPFRDDVRRRRYNEFYHDVNDRDVILVDDVLYTGRTIRAKQLIILCHLEDLLALGLACIG